MVEIFGKKYFIDVERAYESCRLTEYETQKKDSVDKDLLVPEMETFSEINLFKYDLIKMCIERLLNEYVDIDEEIGFLGSEKTTISFKFAYNTLIKYEIIIEENE